MTTHTSLTPSITYRSAEEAARVWAQAHGVVKGLNGCFQANSQTSYDALPAWLQFKDVGFGLLIIKGRSGKGARLRNWSDLASHLCWGKELVSVPPAPHQTLSRTRYRLRVPQDSLT